MPLISMSQLKKVEINEKIDEVTCREYIKYTITNK